MREIKFDIIENGKSVGIERLTESGWQWQYFSLNPDNGIRWANGVLNNHKLIRRQFTGFHDSNGKEIYEGDILVYHTENSMSDMEVKYENGSFIGVGPFNTHPLSVYLQALDFQSIEVSGNVYESQLKQ